MAKPKLKIILTDGTDSRELLGMVHRGDEAYSWPARSARRRSKRSVRPYELSYAPIASRTSPSLTSAEALPQVAERLRAAAPLGH